MRVVRKLFLSVSLGLTIAASLQAQGEGHWILTPENLVEGAFRDHKGGRPLRGAQDLRFLGEGEAAALRFRPEDRYLVADAAAEPASLPRVRLSIEAWVAVEKPSAWAGFLGAIEDNGDIERGFLLGIRDTTFLFGIATRETGRLTYVRSPMSFQLGRWYHVVGTYDGDVARLFVDGRLAVEEPAPGGPILYADRHELVVGAYKDRNEDYRLTGALQSLTLDDRAWSPRDIRKRFTASKAPLPEIPAPASPDLVALQPRINAAIDRGVEHLRARQFRDGTWSPNLSAYPNGQTALNAYALLSAGLPATDPSLRQALAYLRGRLPIKVYSMGCQLMLLGEVGDPADKKHVRQCVERLLEWESDREPGGWAYPSGRVDISNSQFAALGFWGASRLGVRVPAAVWRRMISKSIERHQTIIELLPLPGATRKHPVASFTYFENAEEWPPSGSMGTAGLCILGLGRQLRGRELGGTLLRRMGESERLCFAWLDHYWTVRRNPGYTQDEGHLYYLYGLERVGAFFEREQIGAHDWYLEGARYLVEAQKKDGGWGRQDETAFALLFLSRATAGPTTGGQVQSTPKVVVQETGPLQFRVTGDFELTFFITGLAETLTQRMSAESLSIDRVEWLVNDEVVAVSEFEGTGRFAARHTLEAFGRYRVTARAHLTIAGQSAHETVLSDSASVDVAWTSASWTKRATASKGPNLLRPEVVQAKASSAEELEARAAIDGLAATAWLAKAEDPEPWIRLSWAVPVEAEAVTLAHANASFEQQRQFDSASRVELRVNRDVVSAFAIDAFEPGTIVLPFGERLIIRNLEVRILEREKGSARAGRVGFSEIGLR